MEGRKKSKKLETWVGLDLWGTLPDFPDLWLILRKLFHVD